ncbi:MAG: PHP domain-containing protein, partial [Lachnospiraceae bacterium]|nr:PHP domain-containing protein [Lachnospiraceae bacterium]
MEPKAFLEVFKTLDLKKGLREIFDDVMVSKVSSNKQKDVLKIYIQSTHIIPKKDIYAVIKEIKKQLFESSLIDIRIIEEYRLPENYTVKLIMDEYMESIYHELSENNKVLESVVKKAKISEVDSNHVEISLPDTKIIKDRESEILTYLNKAICERFNISAVFTVAYYHEETKDIKQREEWDEYRISQLVKERVGNIATASYDEEAGAKAEAKEEKKEAEVKETPAKKPAKEKEALAKKEFAPKGDFQKKDFKRPRRNFEKSDNPDVLWGCEISEEEEFTPIEALVDDFKTVVFRGKIIANDTRDIRNNRTIFSFNVTDFTDTIKVKLFIATEETNEYLDKLGPGKFVKVMGMPKEDPFDHELALTSPQSVMVCEDFTTSSRKDLSPVKRVELHCHTKMSDMDGITDVSTLVKRAYSWGHRALAVTD